MKKITIQLILLIAAFLGCCFDGGTQPIVTSAASYDGPEGTIQVPVTVDNLADVSSISLSMNFPSSFMEYLSSYPNQNLTTGFLIVDCPPPCTQVRLAWFGLLPLTLSQGSVLVTFEFMAVDGDGMFIWDTLVAGNCMYSNLSGYEIPSIWINGSIHVSDTTPEPGCAVDPQPEDGSSSNPALLMWAQAGGDPTGYRVYFGTDNPPQNMVQDSYITQYNPGNLDPGTQYFWKIVPYNNNGEAANCACWSFTTPACPNITGHVVYMNDDLTALYNVQVELKTDGGVFLDNTTTDIQGSYSFCRTQQGLYMIELNYEASTGSINAADALQVLRHYVGQITLSGLKLLAADVNANGYVNTTDALLVLKKFTGQISSFPAGEWVFETPYFTAADTNLSNIQILGLCYGDVDGSFTPQGCTPLPSQSDAGPDQQVAGNTTNLQGNNPVDGTGNWSILTGSNGIISDSSDPGSSFTGVAGETYTLVWLITNPCGSSADTVVLSFIEIVFTCGDNFTDIRDNQVYPTVLIGNQCWMARNLNIGNMISASTNQANNQIIEKYCNSNQITNCSVYGGLYQWAEMMGYSTTPGIQGICPEGFHLPTIEEFTQLTDYLGGTSVAGGKMKVTGLAHWNSPNTGATNSSGFSGLGGGLSNNGSFNYLKEYGYFWSSTQYSASTVQRTALLYNTETFIQVLSAKSYGMSVRCVLN